MSWTVSIARARSSPRLWFKNRVGSSIALFNLAAAAAATDRLGASVEEVAASSDTRIRSSEFGSASGSFLTV